MSTASKSKHSTNGASKKNRAVAGSSTPSLTDTPSVYVEWMDIDSIPFAETNPKKHDIGLLSVSLKRYGAVATPILNETTGRLVVGHGRIEAMRVLKMQGEMPPTNIRVVDGKWFVPVLRGNRFKNEQEAAAYLLDDNSLTLLGGDVTTLEVARMWETDGYTQLLAALATQDALPVTVEPDGLDVLLDMALKESGNGANGEGDAAGEETIDRAEELQAKWQVKRGDVWEIPSGVIAGKAHRVMCGDSTNAADVEKLMGGERAVAMWTDPPYGVEYVGKTKDALKIKNDGASGLPQLLNASFANADKVLVDGAPIYVAHPPGVLQMEFLRAFIEAGWKLHETIIWLKDSMVLGHSDYHYMHEPILYGWKNGTHFWYGARNQVSVIPVDRPKRSELHPTMKPVALIEKCLLNSTQRAELVFEPFLGSGSTLIACENLGRIGRGIELDPKYVSVCLERLILMGLAPVKVSEQEN